MTEGPTEQPDAAPDESWRIPGWQRTATVLGGVYFFDAIWAGQGALSMLVAVIGVLSLMVAGSWSAIRKNRLLMRSRFVRAGLYLVFGVASVTTVRWHAKTASDRAEQVIAAVRGYEAAHGALPPELDALVPEYLPSVPSAKYTMQWSEFTYLVTDTGDSHVLMYVAFPPFGRQLYSFENDAWTQLD